MYGCQLVYIEEHAEKKEQNPEPSEQDEHVEDFNIRTMFVKFCRRKRFVRLLAGFTGVKYNVEDRFVRGHPLEKEILEAKEKEMENMKKNNVLKLVPRSDAVAAGAKPIKCKWVITVKKGEGTTVVKARLVAKGFTQIEGVDYNETFAGVVHGSSLNILIANAVQNGWDIYRWDAKAAFLQAHLEERIYMEQPSGFKDGSNQVILLQKSIYGLKQAAHMWNECFTKHLFNCGWVSLRSHPCVFILIEGKNSLMGALHVDDFHVTGNSKELREKAFAAICARYEMVDEGKTTSILAQRFTQYPDGSAKLDLQQFTEAALEKFKSFIGFRTVNTPMQQGTHLCKAPEGAEPYMDLTEYKSHVGILMYLSSRTRPDIAFAVMQLSRFAECPQKEHIDVLRRVWQFLACTKEKGLVFTKDPNGLQPVFYCDADWANDRDDGRSVTGYVGFLAGAPFVVKSKMQSVVSLSTCEAEYIAMCAAGNEACWTRMFLSELGIPTKTILMHADNQSAIALGKKPVLNQRTKHILTKYHKVRDDIKDGTFEPEYIKTDINVADIFTNALGPNPFGRHQSALVN